MDKYSKYTLIQWQFDKSVQAHFLVAYKTFSRRNHLFQCGYPEMLL